MKLIRSFLFCLAAMAAAAQTPVEFPLASMFGGAGYNKSFHLESVRPLITDNTRIYIGTSTNVTPSGGTNPIVYLTPNDYTVTFVDSRTPWRISVPNTNTLQNALALTLGSLPTFIYVPPTVAATISATNTATATITGNGSPTNPIAVTVIGGSGTKTTNASDLVTGTLDVARLPSSVVTNGSRGVKFYNPAGNIYYGSQSGNYQVGGTNGSVSINVDGSGAQFSGTFTGNGSGLTGLQASAMAGVVTNGQTNAIFSKNFTNDYLERYPDVSGNTLTEPVPQIFFLCGNGIFTEDQIKTSIDMVYTNGLVNYGFNVIQQDQGFLGRDSNGVCRYDPTNYPSGGRALVQYAHDRGIKYTGFISMYEDGYGFQQVGSYSNYISDAWQIATNFQWDGVKVDTDGGQNSAIRFREFVSALNDSGRPMSIHLAGNYFGNGDTNADYNYSPYYNSFVNSYYVAGGQPDPQTGLPTIDPWINRLNHFKVEVKAARYYTRPGRYVEGVGWQPSGNTMTNALEMAAILAEPIQIGLPSYVGGLDAVLINTLTNSPIFLNIIRDRAVIPARAAYTNANGSLWVRPLADKFGTNKYVMFLNEGGTTTMTLNSTNLHFPSGSTFTLTSPWSKAIEAWATNTYTQAIGSSNTASYLVQQGYLTPNLIVGTNYLSDQPARAKSYGFTRDFRDNGNAISINSVTYSKGFCTLVQTNVVLEFPLGKLGKTFTGKFGVQDQWLGSGSSQITISLDGTQVFKSGVIATGAQATNIVLDVSGADAITIQITNGICQSSIGGAIVTRVSNGIYAGDGSGLTGIADSALSANVALRNQDQTWSGHQSITNSGTFGGATFTNGTLYVSALRQKSGLIVLESANCNTLFMAGGGASGPTLQYRDANTMLLCANNNSSLGGNLVLSNLTASGAIITKTNLNIVSGSSGYSVMSVVGGTNYWVNDSGGGIFVTNHIP